MAPSPAASLLGSSTPVGTDVSEFPLEKPGQSQLANADNADALDKFDELTQDVAESQKKSAAAAEPALPPVPILKLFRFATKTDILLNIVGLFCSIASGVITPTMT
ncbi:hypothetical protein GGF42_007216, partial [Coemansia sp. RSA 2424]